jgi:hypothetical protein
VEAVIGSLVDFNNLAIPIETLDVVVSDKPVSSVKLKGWSFGERFSFAMGGVIFRGGTPARRQPFARAMTKSPTWSGDSISATTPVDRTTK